MCNLNINQVLEKTLELANDNKNAQVNCYQHIFVKLV
jgi:hypothetical protein